MGLLLGTAAAIVGVESPAALPLRPWHLLVLIALVIALYGRFKAGPFRLFPNRWVLALDLAFIAFVVGLTVIEIVNAATLHYPAVLSSQGEPVFWFLAYAAARFAVSDAQQAAAALKSFVLPIFVVAPLSVAQLLRVEPVLDFTTSIVTAHGFEAKVGRDALLRAVGLIGGWTSLGAYASGIFAIGVALLVLARSGRSPKGLLGFVLAILLCSIVTVLTTLTASTILAFGLILLGSVRYLRLHFSVYLSMAGMVLLGVIVFHGPLLERFHQLFAPNNRVQDWLPGWVPNTIAHRVNIWRSETIPAIAEQPWTGWGRGVYQAALPPDSLGNSERLVPSGLRWASADSQWLSTTMTSGLLGLLLLLALLVCAGVVVVKGTRIAEAAWLARPVGWLFFANLLIAFTAMNLTNKGFPGVIWPLIGFVVALSAFASVEGADIADDEGVEPSPAVPAEVS